MGMQYVAGATRRSFSDVAHGYCATGPAPTETTPTGVYAVTVTVGIGAMTLGVSRLKPAAPSVDRGTVLVDAVKRGDMVVDVRGQGTLVPEDIRWRRRKAGWSEFCCGLVP